MSVFEIVFSPTGGTQKVSGLVAGALGKNTVTVDLTDSGLDFNAVSMTGPFAPKTIRFPPFPRDHVIRRGRRKTDQKGKIVRRSFSH